MLLSICKYSTEERLAHRILILHVHIGSFLIISINKDINSLTCGVESMTNNIFYQRFIAMYNGGYKISCNWSRFKPGFKVKHTEDKHDTPPSHLKLTLGQPALF